MSSFPVKHDSFSTTSNWSTIYIGIALNAGESNGKPLQYSCLENPMDGGAWWATVHAVATSRLWLSDFTFTFHFHALEKEMATHSSVLAWRIPGTAEPGGLMSMGSHRVGHNWSDLAVAAALNARVSGINIGANTSFSLFLFLSWSFGPYVNRAPGDLPWPAKVPTRNAEAKLLWDPSLAIMTNASFLLQ